MLTRNFSKIFLLASLCIGTHAEYRVYQYMISSRLQAQGPTSVIVTSTLDPNSYVKYHGGSKSIRVNLMKTWTCKGYTGNKSYCKDPLSKVMRLPANEDENNEL